MEDITRAGNGISVRPALRVGFREVLRLFGRTGPHKVKAQHLQRGTAKERKVKEIGSKGQGLQLHICAVNKKRLKSFFHIYVVTGWSRCTLVLLSLFVTRNLLQLCVDVCVCVPFVIVHAVFALSTVYSALELVWKFQRLKYVGVTLRYIVICY